MPDVVVMRAPRALSAPLPNTPVMRMRGDITVIAHDSFDPLPGFPEGSGLTDRPLAAPTGRTPLAWASTAYGTISGGVLVHASTAAMQATVTIPEAEPPAIYEARWRPRQLPIGNTTIILFAGPPLGGQAGWDFSARLRMNGTTMMATLCTVFSASGSSTFDVGDPFPFKFGDTLAIRAQRGSKRLVALVNDVVVIDAEQHPTHSYLLNGRSVILAGSAPSGVLRMDDFQLTQTLT